MVDAMRDRLVTTNTSAFMFLWDAGSGDVIARRDFTSIPRFAPTQGVFVPTSGDLVVATRYTGLMRLEAETLQLVAQSDIRAGQRIRISSDGRRITFAGEGRVTVVRVEDLSVERYLSGSENPTDFAFSRDGESLWVGDIEGKLSLWSLTGAAAGPEATLSFDAGVGALATDGEVLAVGLTDGRIELHSLQDGTPLASLGRNPGPVQALDFHPYEPLLLSSGSSVSGDVSLRFWDTEAGQLRLELLGPGGRLRAAAFGGGGSWIAARSTQPKGHVLIDEVPRYRGSAMVEAARERVRARIDALFEDWPYPEALLLAWEVEPNLDSYEYRAGRALAFERWAHAANSAQALERLAGETERVKKYPEASAVLARYVATGNRGVPQRVTAARVTR